MSGSPPAANASPVSAVAAAEEPAPPSGPILYGPAESQYEELQYNLFGNLLSADGTDWQRPMHGSSVDPGPWEPARFSPDGGMVAAPVPGDYCDSGLCDGSAVAVIELTRAGEIWPTRVGGLADVPVDLAWSPDGTAIAALVPIAGGDSGYRIVRVNLATGAVTVVRSSTASLRIEESGISWGSNGLIAFIGSTPEESHDIYSMPAAGGTPTRYNGEFPHDDEVEWDETFCSGSVAAEYHQPAWSPDGTSIVARFVHNDNRGECDGDYRCDPRDQLVQVTAGLAQPRIVRTLPIDDPGYCEYVEFDSHVPEPVWSSDGTEVLYAYDHTFSNWPGDGVETLIVNVDTLAETDVVTVREKLTTGDDLERIYAGYYKDWQPCPTGTCVRWEGAEGPDLRVKIDGYGDPGRVGQAEPVRINVANIGSEDATNVGLAVVTARSTTQAWVQWRGAHDGWTCDTSDAANLRCSAPTLSAGASVTLELGVVAAKKVLSATMTAAVATSSDDSNLVNNQTSAQQKIGRLVKPPAPTSAGREAALRAGRPWGWFKVNAKRNLWILADNIVYKEPNEGEGLPGWYGATLWGFAPHRKVYRLNFKNRVCGTSGGICIGFLGHPSDGGDCYFGRSDYCYLITGSRVIFEGTKVQRATWKFYPGRIVGGVVIRTGTAKKYTYDLPRR